MRNNLIKVVLFFFVAYSSTAQAVLSLQDDKTIHFDNVNHEGIRTGGGVITLEEGLASYNGTLTDKGGQRMIYSNRFNFKNTIEGLELGLRFYLNPFTYSSNLKVSYEGDNVVLPGKLSTAQLLPDAIGTHTFLVNGKTFITEKAKLTNRKVTATEELEFKGAKRTAFIIVSDYESERIHRVSTTRSSDKITEWYIPGTGIIKSKRETNGSTIIFKLK